MLSLISHSGSARFWNALILVASFAIVAPGRPIAAQTTYTGGGAINLGSTVNGSASSTLPVSGASGTVASVKVALSGVTSDGQVGYSLYTSNFILKSPDGRQFVLLGSTGDSVDGDDLADAGSGLSNVNITVQDGASAAPNGTPWQHTGSITVKPSSYWAVNLGSVPTNTPSYPQTDGSSSLSSAFAGATPNGNWTLTVQNYDGYGTAISVSSWSLTLTFNSLSASTTSLSTSTNPIFTSSPGNTVTITATVTPGATGTVTFTGNGSNLTCSGGNPASLSGGQAVCSTSIGSQGLWAIKGTYSGNGSFAGSSGTLNQLVEVHPTQTGDTWCNNGPIAVPTGGAGTVYPSFIHVSGYNAGATVADVTVKLNSVSWSGLPGQHLLVSPDGNHNLDFFDLAWSAQVSTISPVTLTFFDTAGQTPNGAGNPSSGNYEPYDNNRNFPFWSSSDAPSIDSAIPQVPGTVNFAAPIGSSSQTFVNDFNGASANGDWALYPYDNSGTTESIAGGWCITLDINTGVSTTSTVTSSANPAVRGNSLTFTAAVRETAGGNPVTSGTVTFLDNNLTPAGTVSGNNVVTVDGSGHATFTTSSLVEGDHHITVTYNGDVADNLSTGSMWQRVDSASTISAGANGSVNFCNSNPVSAAQAVTGAFTPNPSNIFTSSLPGTLNSVSLTLNTLTVGGTINQTESLLKGPTGAALDFFSNTSNSSTTTGGGNYVFSDSAASLVGTSTLSPGTFKPTAYQNSSHSTDSFTSSSSGFYNAPGTFGYAAPHGSATFNGTFGSTNPNGTWSLFFNQVVAEQAISAANGWCLNFFENPVAVSITEGHSGNGSSGDFVQGETGAHITTSVTNEGTGSTGDPVGTNPLKVVDTLNSALTYTGYSGTGWSCSVSSQTVTCTNDSSVAQDSSYPTLRLDANVSGTAAASLSNQVSVSGAGITSNTGSDTITVDPAPVLSVSKGHTGIFTQGSTAEWDLTVNNATAGSQTLGTMTVTDVLPTGYTLSGSSSTGNAWGCGSGSGSNANVITCTSTTSIAGGSSSIISLVVNVPAASPTSVSNAASAYGGGDLTHTSLVTAAVSNTDAVTVLQVPASIVATSGGGQSVIDTNTFPNPLAATVKDAGGVAVPGVVVTFGALPQTGASLTFAGGVNTATTNASGVATSSAITANNHLGTYSVTASANGLQATFQLTNSIGPVSLIAVSAPTTAFVGVPLQFTVAAEDVGGNVETGFSDTVQFSSSDSAASLPANSILTNGTGMFTAILNTLGSQTISGTDTSNSIAGTSSNITVSSLPNLVVTTASDDAGSASNCTTQAASGTGTDASCSLRDALAEANSLGAASVSFDSIRFGSPTTITLSNGVLAVPAFTAIHGATSGSGATLKNLVTVSGNNASPVFTIGSGAANVSIANLVISQGSASGAGGGLSNAGSLTLTASTITGNRSTGSGGGIENTGSLIIYGSAISANSATQGGGIDNSAAGTVTLTDSTLSGNAATNQGGGIYNSGGALTVADSTISGNFGGASGGGIYSSGGTVALGNLINSGNRLGTLAVPGNYDDMDDTTGNSTFTAGNNGGNVLGYYNAPSAIAPSPSINLSGLSSNGGPTQTMLPLPGSPAICGGLQTAIASGVSTDQRGLPNTNTTYPGFSAGAPCVDSGAAQTNYAIAFSTQPSPISPASSIGVNSKFQAAVTLSESGNPLTASAVTIPLTFTGWGMLSGGSASTSNGVAVYSALKVNALSDNDTLAGTVSLNGALSPALSLTTASSSFVVVGSPFGYLDGALDATTRSATVVQAHNLLVSGWAADLQDGAPVSQVKILIDGTAVGTATLGILRADIPAHPNSGWRFVYAASGLSLGTHTVAAVAYNALNISTTLGTKTITVSSSPSGAPFGWVDKAVDATSGSTTIVQPNTLLVSGWAADPQDGAPVSSVKILLDGNLLGTATLGISRPDVAAYPNSGWKFTYPSSSLATGNHRIQVIATDSLAHSTTLDTKVIGIVAKKTGKPFGYIDRAIDALTHSTTVAQADSILVSGWAADPKDTAPVSTVKILIDGNVVGNAMLGQLRADVIGYPNSGWQFTYPAAGLSNGTHTVTAVAYDSLNLFTTLGSKTITVGTSSAGPPTGNLEQAVDATTNSATVSQIHNLVISGWAADPHDGAPVDHVQILIDGNVVGNATLGLFRWDVVGYPRAGWTFSYAASSLSTGTHTITAVAFDSLSLSTSLGTKSITVTP